MRSRASGGICGDSSAAPSAATMSSLRRRAIWVQRARSIARSSTGGRASARTTAPASPGSTSSRSQASRSRTSARWKKAAAPDEPVGHGALLQRRGDRLALALDRAHEHADVLRARRPRARPAARRRPRPPAPARARSRSARTRPRPPARPGARRARFVDPPLGSGATTARAAARIRSPAAEALAQAHDRRRPATRRGSRRCSSSTAPRKRWIDWSSSPATVTLPCSATSRRSSRPWAKLVSWKLVDEHVRGSGAARRARTCGLVRSSRNACSDEVAEVERARLGEHAVVGGVDRGELALARGPRPVGLGLLRAASPPRPRSRSR